MRGRNQQVIVLLNNIIYPFIIGGCHIQLYPSRKVIEGPPLFIIILLKKEVRLGVGAAQRRLYLSNFVIRLEIV